MEFITVLRAASPREWARGAVESESRPWDRASASPPTPSTTLAGEDTCGSISTGRSACARAGAGWCGSRCSTARSLERRRSD